jgi:S-adenosylmethionine:tRNA ribosyltransferase-isomerase
MHPKYEYVYELPERLLAHEAIEPRDAARLFVFNTKDGSITHDYFYNLDKYIPAESIFVLNKTRVVKARCEMYKQTGGKLECFFLTNEIKDYARLPVLVDRRLEVGSAIYTYDKRYSFNVESQNENIFYLKSDLSRDEFYKFLEMYGQTPLPKYIKSTEANSDKVYERYNTTFAETGTSVAAPTASLHFTHACRH